MKEIEKKEFIFNIVLILVLIIIDVTGDYIVDKTKLVSFWKLYFSLSVTFFITSLLVYFLNYIGTLRFLLQRKYWQYTLFFILLIILFGCTRFFLEEVVLFKITGNHNYNLNRPLRKLLFIYGLDSFYYTLRIVLISSLICLVFKNLRDKKAMYELSLAHQKAQLATLKSQISPHFLFNTLNNFYVELYDDKPETAKDVLKLAQLLRYVTYETSDDFVSLEKEVDFVKDYLHFFKRRYENDFNVSFIIKGEIKEQKVLSLVLIHFIENVCKHGIINDKNRPAIIKLDITEKTLDLNVENYNNTSQKHEESGIGTENIQRRLKVVYEDNYILEQQKSNETFKAYLKINL